MRSSGSHRVPSQRAEAQCPGGLPGVAKVLPSDRSAHMRRGVPWRPPVPSRRRQRPFEIIGHPSTTERAPPRTMSLSRAGPSPLVYGHQSASHPGAQRERASRSLAAPTAELQARQERAGRTHPRRICLSVLRLPCLLHLPRLHLSSDEVVAAPARTPSGITGCVSSVRHTWAAPRTHPGRQGSRGIRGGHASGESRHPGTLGLSTHAGGTGGCTPPHPRER